MLRSIQRRILEASTAEYNMPVPLHHNYCMALVWKRGKGRLWEQRETWDYSLGQVITCKLVCSDQHLQWRPASVRQTSLKPPTVGLPARDPVFRHMSLWSTRHFTFKPFRWDCSSVTPKRQYLQQGMMAGSGVRTLRGLTNQRNSTPEKSPPRLTLRPFGWLVIWMPRVSWPPVLFYCLA